MSFTKKTASSHVLSCTSTNNNTICVRGSALYAEGSPTPYNAAEIQGVGDRVGKNLIPYPYAETTKTMNGITFTDNGDGTVTANGTATATAEYKMFPFIPEKYFNYPAGNYILSGCPAGGSTTTYCINYALSSKLSGYDIFDKKETGRGLLCPAPDGIKRIYAKIMIYSGTTCTNFTFKPKLEVGTAATKYVSYGEEEKYEIPIKISGKNMLDIAGINDKGCYSATISSGVKISYDKDTQIITLNGTSTSSISTNQFVLNGEISGDVIISAKVIGGSVSGSGYYFGLASSPYVLPGDVRIQLTENGIDTTKSAGTRTPQKSGKYVVIQSNAAVTYNNFQFQLQIEEKCETPIKILIPYPYVNTTKTQNGLTFTDNGDGSITVNGTATAEKTFFVCTTSSKYPLEKGKYMLSGCPEGGSASTYRIYLEFYKGTTWKYNISDTGSGKFVDCSAIDYTGVGIGIVITKDTVCENLVFRPKLVKFEDTAATEYEPYYESIEKIITLSHPLYGKDGNFDNVNFKSGKALRNVFYKELTGNEKWQQSDKYINTYYATDVMNRRAPYGHRYCSHYKEVLAPDIEVDREEKATGIMWDMIPLLIRDDNCKTIDEFKAFLKEQKDMGNPVTLVVTAASFDKPYTENIDMPTLPTIDGTTKIKIDTKIVPENVDISFYQYQDEDGE